MPKSKITILIADDSLGSRQIIARMLEGAGYSFIEAADGEAALGEMLSGRADLALLDISMPGLDGFEVCRRLRAHYSSAEFPVIFLTGHTDDSSLADGFAAGGNDYISKPISRAVMLSRLNAQISSLTTSRALKRSYERLAQQRRMEMLGTFAAGVAHNFNNVLGTVLGSAELIELYIKQKDRNVADAAAMIVEAAKRGAALTASLMTIARPEDTTDCPQPLAIARSAVTLATQIAEQVVCLELTHDAEIPAVQISPQSLSQILLELLKNSIEALSSNGCVSLHVSRDPEVAPARSMICFTVSDTGCGIDEALRERVFTPFVSTKRADGHLGIALDGSGLGLSIVSSLVAAAGGTVAIIDTSSAGTSIEVRLPIADTALEQCEPQRLDTQYAA